MAFEFRSVAAATALASLLVTAAGCGVGEPSTANSENNGATANSDGATTTNASEATTMTATGTAGALPPECQAYLNSVQACLDRVQDPAAVAQVRETLDVNRDAIMRLSHDGSPLEVCLSANNAWESRRGNFGC